MPDYRWLPSQRENLVDGSAKTTLGYYGFFDALARRVGGPNGIADGKIVYSNNGIFSGATVGPGLVLDRATETLYADTSGGGIPEAPIDGFTYGRRNAAWTRVSGVPGAPDTSVQFNEGGIFGGSPLLTWNYSSPKLNVNADFSLGGATSGDQIAWSKAASTLTFRPPSAMIIDSGNITSGAAGFYIQGLSVGPNPAYLKVYASPSGTATTAGFSCYNEPVGTTAYQAAAYQIDNTSAAFSSWGFGGASAYPFTWGFGPNGLGVNDYHTILYPTGNLRLLSAGQNAPLPSDTGYKIDCGGTALFRGKVTLTASTTGAASLNVPHGTAPTSPTNGDFWSTTSGFFGRVNGATIQFGSASPGGSNTQVQFNDSGAFGGDAGLTYDKSTDTLTGVNFTTTGLALTAASVTGGAGFRLPHGTAPSSPVNGDLWTTTAGLFARINGATVGPFIDSGGGGGGAPTNAEYVVLSANGTLTDERVLTAGAGISLTDGGPGGNLVIAATGGSAFSPVDIPSLAAWWDAEDLAATLSSGASAIVWANRVGNLGFQNLLPTGTPPTFVTNVINGLPVLRFNGSNTYMTAPFTNSTSTNQNKEMTFFVVARPTGSGNRGLLGRATGGGSHYEYQVDVPNTSTSYTLYQNLGASYANVGAYGSNPTSNTPCIVTAQSANGIRASAWRDGGARITTTSFSGSQTTGTSLFYVGQRGDSSGTSFFSGDIAAILVYTRYLSFDEIDAVNDYLATRYSISVSPVS
jgi:hypothetical protein